MQQPKPLLFFFGHSYHQLTGSSQFFIDLLLTHYRVEIFWDESWQYPERGLTADVVNAIDPDVIIFYQMTPHHREIAKMRCKNKIVVPMHDQVVQGSLRNWRRLLRYDVRAINFCAESHRRFSEIGYSSLSVQYWPTPPAGFKVFETKVDERLKVLFWIRRPQINWLTLKALLGNHRPETIILRVAADPGEEIVLPDSGDQREYNIQIVEGWLSKDDYLSLLKACNLYVAPRQYEGIGLSFLEAMAHGLAVIAPNLPTMNEYINADTGYLYDPHRLEPVDFSQLAQVRKRALQSVTDGNNKWLRQQADVLAFIDTDESKASLSSRVLGWVR
jgi:glycosyltransferase involved in cell wall biosynthesis